MEFLKNIFQTPGGDTKWGSVAAAGGIGIVGALAGALIGGGSLMSVIIGALIGLVGGTAFNDKITGLFSNVTRNKNELPPTDPERQEVPGATIQINKDGKKEDVAIDSPAGLKELLKTNNNTLEDIAKRRLEITKDPLDPKAGTTLSAQKSEVAIMNKDFYNGIFSVESAALDVRNKIPSASSLALPAFTIPENLVLFLRQQGTSSNDMPTSKVKQLSRIEDATYANMAELATRQAELDKKSAEIAKAESEESKLGLYPTLAKGLIIPAAVPITLAASAAYTGYRAAKVVASPVIDLIFPENKTKVERAVNEFVKNGDEARFEKEMKTIAADEEKRDGKHSKEIAGIIREQAGVLIESHKLEAQANQITELKKDFSKQADAWVKEYSAFVGRDGKEEIKTGVLEEAKKAVAVNLGSAQHEEDGALVTSSAKGVVAKKDTAAKSNPFVATGGNGQAV